MTKDLPTLLSVDLAYEFQIYPWDREWTAQMDTEPLGSICPGAAPGSSLLLNFPVVSLWAVKGD